MIVFISSIILFNLLAFTTNKRLNKNQLIHIWTFTISFQAVTETFIDFKYHGYWYFTKEINWFVLPALTVIIPPVNMLYLNWYPFQQKIYKQIIYIFCWVIAITLYKLVAILPEPWGCFRYGWWKTRYSFILNPFLLVSVLAYYKWVSKSEEIR